MTTFDQYLDAYKAAHGITTDSDLGAHMGTTRQYVTQLRKKGVAPDSLCLEIARVLKVEPGLILLSRNALKESGPVGEAWKRLLGKVAGVSLVIAASLFSPSKNTLADLLHVKSDISDTRKPLILLIKITGNIVIAFIIRHLRRLSQQSFRTIEFTGSTS